MLVFVNITKLSIQHFKTNSFVVGGNGWVGVCLCILERKPVERSAVLPAE